MALVTRAQGDQANASDIDQFYYAFTGMMADQLMTFAGKATLVGSDTQALILQSPNATLSVIGASGSSSVTYQVVANNDTGDTIPGTAVTITTAPAALSSSNKVRVSFSLGVPFTTSGFGAKSFKILRTAGGPSQGLIGTVQAVNNQTAYTFDDVGGIASAYTAATMPIGGKLQANAYTAGLLWPSGTSVSAARFIGLIPTSGVTGGTWQAGDWGIDTTARVWVCTTGGTGGTWVHS